MVKFFIFDYISIHISRQSSLFSLQEHLQINPTSLAKWNIWASFQFRVRKRPKKYFLLSMWRRELHKPGPRFFYYLINMKILTESPVCSSRFDWQNRFLFSENSFSEEIASSWLLTVNWSQVFPDKKKQPSLEWRCVHL